MCGCVHVSFCSRVVGFTDCDYSSRFTWLWKESHCKADQGKLERLVKHNSM